MRIRELELRRYGHFDGHHVDFGDGAIDFHLVVGPNEAGKSTLLSAITDLFFGIEERTRLGFKHSMQELELAAWLEHGSKELRFIRRKRRALPITDLAGTPISDDVLLQFLHGIDRAAFNNMFGLSYDSLTKGGRSILENRDDGSRVVLEAESGLTGLGQLITDLDKRADEIFVPRGRQRELNNSLRDLEQAQRRMRDATVEERRWTALVEKRDGLEDERKEVMKRLGDIAGDLLKLERVRRTAPYLAQLEAYAVELNQLADVPSLPEDAAKRRADAELAIAGTTAKRNSTQEAITAARQQLQSIVVRTDVLALGDEIDALAEEHALEAGRRSQRPVLLSGIRDLESQISAIRKSAAIKGDIPDKLARERLANAATQCRDQAEKIDRLVRQETKLSKELRLRTDELEALPDVTALEPIKALYDAAPRRIAHHEAEAEATEAEARDSLDTAMAALLPWRGDPTTLACVEVPSVDRIRGVENKLSAFDSARMQAERRVQEARTALGDAKTKLEALRQSGGDLPTTEVLLAMREERNARWKDVRQRLLDDRRDRAADSSAAAEFEVSIERADGVADRRYAEVNRLAAYDAITEALSGHQQTITNNEAAARDAIEALAAEEANWSIVTASLGFAEAVTPARVVQWLSERQVALDAAKRQAKAAADLDKLRKTNAAHISALRHKMVSTGIDCPDDLLPDGVLARAMAAVTDLTTARADRKSVADAIGRLHTEIIGVEGDLEVTRAEAELRARARTTALRAVGLPDDSDDIAIDAALAAFDDLEELLDALEGKKADGDALDGALKSFEQRVKAVREAVKTKASGDTLVDVKQLAGLLSEAQQQEALQREATDRIANLEEQLVQETQAIDDARAEIEALCRLAHLTDEAELSDVIAKSDRRRELERLRQEAEANLLATGDGLDLQALRDEGEGKTPEEVISKIELLKGEQEQLNSRRENLRLELEAAIAEARDLSSGADAALALQDAEEATAQAGELAEQFVATKAAAAVLRWALAKHRATRAAPLLDRASALMADITDGSIAKLELEDFDASGKPIIVGRRAGGENVAVDDMSEGTRDQLYLALRLASLEDRLATHAMPFICDDLLINCDDDRAALIIKALHAISKRTQVLCFTHHQHLRAVVEGAIGANQVRLHELAPIGTARKLSAAAE